MGEQRIKREAARAFQELLSTIPTLKAHHLKLLITKASKERQRRYPRKHRPKYGHTVRRLYNDEEYHRFITHCKNPKAQLAAKIAYNLGTRSGETVIININDINRITDTIIIHTLKSNTEDVLPLHDGIKNDLYQWIDEHYKEIIAHNGYVLYSDHDGRDYISKDWLRAEFARARTHAGLTQIYGQSEERAGRKPRRLYCHSGHSFRRSFGTSLWRDTKDLKIVQHGLRQQSVKSTEPYVFQDPEEVHAVIRRRFQRVPDLITIER